MADLLAFPAVKRETPPVFDLKGPWTVENGPATGAAHLIRNRDGQVVMTIPRDPEEAQPMLPAEDRARLAACIPALVQGGMLAIAPGGSPTRLLQALASAMPRQLPPGPGGAA